MSTLKFKTNLKCDGCVAKITPVLNGNADVENWEVDLQSTEKTLTVEGAHVSAQGIISDLAAAGYKAESI